MSRCNKGKSCGSTCINKGIKCRKQLTPATTESIAKVSQNISKKEGWIEDLVGNLFGVPVKPPQPQEPLEKTKGALILDDISRLLKGEEPQHISLTRDNKSRGNGEVSRLQDALGLGDLTRKEVGRDWEVLKEEALRRKDELREEIRRLSRIGSPATKAKAAKLQKELNKINDALKQEPGKQVSSSTKDARIGAKYFDESFSPEKTVAGKASDYSWETNARTGANGKKGGFGSVLFEGDAVVKRGDIGEKELEIIRKAGEIGIGPELIYGEIGKRKEMFGPISIHDGRVAMTRVQGQELGSFASPKDKVGDSTAGDTFWRARALLHRAGIAHNDCHGGNIIVSERGVPKFVDFGVSQDNPKAALSEAFGGIVNRTVIPPGAVIKGGIRSDVQASKVKVSGIGSPPAEQPVSLKRIYSNLTAVKAHLKKLGMTNDEIAEVMATGIRNPESRYNQGGWGKITNEEAQKIIGMLYDGL
jgi:hypothetical protein